MEQSSSVELRKPLNFFELPALAYICGQAFKDEPLIGGVVHPHRAEYPDDMALCWLRILQQAYFSWDMVIMVATDTDSEGVQTPVGVALWSRKGVGQRQWGWGLAPWDPRNLATRLAKVYVNVASYLYPNRAASPTEQNIFDRALPFNKHFWGDKEVLHLRQLAVHPDHQGRGIGRRLVRWGLEQADKEGIQASVCAVVGKDRFYQRCGYGIYVGNLGDGEGNPLGPMPSPNVYFREAIKA